MVVDAKVDDARVKYPLVKLRFVPEIPVEDARLRKVLPETVSAVLEAKPRVEEPETVRPANCDVPVKTGDAENTTLPAVPVSSVRSAASSAEVSIDDDATLPLKVDQSVVERQPKSELLPVAQVSALLERVSPEPVRSVR